MRRTHRNNLAGTYIQILLWSLAISGTSASG